ncbi:MAG: DNA-binding protein [Actinobacteria bacterium]|nr:MAG: DNA-binding protein [Actinomycetota bacterium]
MSRSGPDERLTVGEVADELGVSEKTVRALIRRGELVAYNLAERKTYVRRGDLDAFVESRRTASVAAGR